MVSLSLHTRCTKALQQPPPRLVSHVPLVTISGLGGGINGGVAGWGEGGGGRGAAPGECGGGDGGVGGVGGVGGGAGGFEQAQAHVRVLVQFPGVASVLK